MKDQVDSPTAWFAILERARMIGDYDLAKRATEELLRLGVRVTFVPVKFKRAGK